MKLCLLYPLAISAAAVSGLAHADPQPPLNEAPRGAGTETGATEPQGKPRVQPGFEANAALGTAFRSVYGLGFSGRLGYTLEPGVYLGGAFTQYVGSGAESATFVGAEGGYKFFPSYHWELRPYAFVGPAFIHREWSSDTNVAFQPSVASAYHFGPWFLSADGRVYLVPAPSSIALFVGGGAGF